MTLLVFEISNETFNTFKLTNMKKPFLPQISEQIAAPLQAIASPQRVAILLTIGRGEACVCHLEAALGWQESASADGMICTVESVLDDFAGNAPPSDDLTMLALRRV